MVPSTKSGDRPTQPILKRCDYVYHLCVVTHRQMTGPTCSPSCLHPTSRWSLRKTREQYSRFSRIRRGYLEAVQQYSTPFMCCVPRRYSARGSQGSGGGEEGGGATSSAAVQHAMRVHVHASLLMWLPDSNTTSREHASVFWLHLLSTWGAVHMVWITLTAVFLARNNQSCNTCLPDACDSLLVQPILHSPTNQSVGYDWCHRCCCTPTDSLTPAPRCVGGAHPRMTTRPAHTRGPCCHRSRSAPSIGQTGTGSGLHGVHGDMEGSHPACACMS
jgi:hypothetical protein